MTKIDIYSGFLGAGKTTLMKKILPDLSKKETVVILENEFGQVAIDGGFLQETGIETRELQSGCICCSLVGDFADAIHTIMDTYQPDRIVVEPSGVGKLSDILAAVRKVGRDDLKVGSAVCVVDGKKMGIYLQNFGDFYGNQIANASVIFVTRTEKMTADQKLVMAGKLRKLNPSATIVTTPWTELSSEKMVETMEKKESLSAKLLEEAQATSGHAKEIFNSWGIETPKTFPKEKISAWCKGFAQQKTFGTVLRAKGYVEGEHGQWYQFDYVPGSLEIRDSSPNVTGQISVIGSGLQAKALEQAL